MHFLFFTWTKQCNPSFRDDYRGGATKTKKSVLYYLLSEFQWTGGCRKRCSAGTYGRVGSAPVYCAVIGLIWRVWALFAIIGPMRLFGLNYRPQGAFDEKKRPHCPPLARDHRIPKEDRCLNQQFACCACRRREFCLWRGVNAVLLAVMPLVFFTNISCFWAASRPPSSCLSLHRCHLRCCCKIAARA